MMKYIVDKTLCAHMVKEVATNQYLAACTSHEVAKHVCSLLNSGSGFNGDTPAFFTKKIVKIDNKIA